MSATLDLAKQLIELPSVTPEDKGCQEIIAKRLEKLGFKIEHLPFENVSNLWAQLGNEGPLFIFAGHTDGLLIHLQPKYTMAFSMVAVLLT